MRRSVDSPGPALVLLLTVSNLGCGGEHKIAGEVPGGLASRPSRARVSLTRFPRSRGCCVRRNSRPLAGTGALVGPRLQECKPVSSPVSAQGWVGMLQSSAIAWAGKVADPPALGQGAMFAWRTGRSACLARRRSQLPILCLFARTLGQMSLETGWQLRGRSALVLLSTSPRHRGAVVTGAAPCL